MEKEVFKQVNLQHNPKALTTLLLQVHKFIECKRTRKFLESWKKDHSWLEHDDVKNEMFCLLCRKYPKVADRTDWFFLGTQSFRLQNIQGHWKCFDTDKAAKNPDARILQNIRNMNERLYEKMLKLFNTAYYLAVNERPMSDFASLCTLQIKISVDLGDFYLNDKRC